MNLAQTIARSRDERESWRYTDLAKLLDRQPAPASLTTRRAVSPDPLPSIMADPLQRQQFVFIDGIYQPDLSHTKDLPPGLLTGNTDHGYRLDVKGQTCLVTSPIELLFITRGPAPERSVKLTISVGANTRLTLIEHHLGLTAAPVAHIIETAIALQPQAKLVHGKILHGQPHMAHLARSAVTVAEGGYYRNFALIQNTRLVRNEIQVTLNGQLAQASLDGVMLLQGQEHADSTIAVIHAAPHGTSGQLYKSVLKDRAHGVFQGRIAVAKNAQKTDGSQLSRALLLSDQAEMDVKPELTIDADDVKCSHGCTIGELDNDAMFYLRARGVPEAQARSLLLHGFITEAIDPIEVEEWRSYARQHIEEWLNDNA